MHQAHIAHSLSEDTLGKRGNGDSCQEPECDTKADTQKKKKKKKTLFVFIFPDKDIENDVILISGEGQDFILEFKRNLFSSMCD